MSTLRMSCPYVGTLNLKVLNFNSPLTGSIATSQTKRARHHWPIKASQQSLSLLVQFRNWPEYDALQKFVRAHHVRSLLTVQYPEVTLYWPQRGMNNWSGLIRDLQAGDERFNLAPRATLELILIDSMLSSKTFTASMGESVAKWHQVDIGNPGEPEFKPPKPSDWLPPRDGPGQGGNR
ncbi:hypothetical protein SEA_REDWATTLEHOG_49 [Gordonia phage RedWattleHog]|uniref:Uncharacterized protein n=1 Tax=Gordonia phage Stormageddon TaxID=2656541 RepID=A0A649VSI9_9CAUD|nr:minor tail protein [Gordonia phage Stormageddon]QGJ94909.1 hypothetical protein SEA_STORMAGEDDON_46 [Gordonia phage Stormageddon]QLF83553.1 hypothetical protein SEA_REDWATTLEHOG_49 [Gordonia phage RedWattleHog]